MVRECLPALLIGHVKLDIRSGQSGESRATSQSDLHLISSYLFVDLLLIDHGLDLDELRRWLQRVLYKFDHFALLGLELGFLGANVGNDLLRLLLIGLASHFFLGHFESLQLCVRLLRLADELFVDFLDFEFASSLIHAK